MPVEVNARNIEMDGKKVFLGSIRDITEHKQAKEAGHNQVRFYEPEI